MCEQSGLLPVNRKFSDVSGKAWRLVPFFEIPIVGVPVFGISRTVVTTSRISIPVIPLTTSVAAIISSTTRIVPAAEIFAIITCSSCSEFIPIRTVVGSVFHKRTVVEFQLAFGDRLQF